MSVKIMQWAWEQPIGNSSRKLVLLALADRSNDDGECWPGLSSLSEKCSIPRRTIIRAIADLEALGILSIEHRAGDGSGRLTNVYRLNVGTGNNGQSAKIGGAKCQPVTRQSANLSLEAKCQPVTRQSAKNGGAKCQSLAPNTSVDTSVKINTASTKYVVSNQRESALSARGDETTDSGLTAGSLSGEKEFFELTPDRVELAKAQGHSDRAWVVEQTIRFANHHRAKPPSPKAIEGAWLNWLRKGREYDRTHAKAPTGGVAGRAVIEPAKRASFFDARVTA